MKIIIKLEALGLFSAFTYLYYHLFPSTWELYISMFFVPDISFLFYLCSKKIGTIAYNILHHQGILILIWGIGYYQEFDFLQQIGLIFLTHSTFDRLAGYGLKYFDSFDHTHLGWIGKNKHLNTEFSSQD